MPLIFRSSKGTRIHVQIDDYVKWKQLCRELRGTDIQLPLEKYLIGKGYKV